MSEFPSGIELGRFVDWVWALKAERDALVANLASAGADKDAYGQNALDLRGALNGARKLLTESLRIEHRLRTERDEGLAREAEYKAQHRRDVRALDKLSQIETDLLNTQHELALFMDGYTGQWQAREALQQRLAKAQEVLAKAIYLQWHDEPGYAPWVEGGNSYRQWEAREEAMEQLRDVGFEDGSPKETVCQQPQAHPARCGCEQSN
jgi:hypothetical protein